MHVLRHLNRLNEAWWEETKTGSLDRVELKII